MHRGAILFLGALLARTAVVNAARRSLALYFAIGVVALVVFAGSGLDAATVVRLASHFTAFRLALLTLWSVATMPAVRGILESPDTFFLRALPIARSSLYAIFTAWIAVAELPWIVLWFRGATAASATCAVVMAMAVHVSIVSRVRNMVDVSYLAVLAALWTTRAPNALAIPLSAAVFFVNLRKAWARAPERSAPARHVFGARGPVTAVAFALALTLLEAPRPCSRVAAFSAWRHG